VDVDRGRIEHLEHQVESLEEAVEHRIVIGEALGIIMERLGVDDAKAFDYLSRCSQSLNRKLYDLACQVVETRELPQSRGGRTG